MPSLFEMDIQKLKGVGEKRKKLFEKLGAPTVGDLLRLYPRAYEDWSLHTPIRETVLNEVAVVKATVLHKPTETRVRGGMTLYKTRATDGESDMALTFFNNKYIPSMLREGQVFYADYAKPDGFCDEAWKAIYQYVFALAHGSGQFYYGDWIEKPGVAICSCNDGLRPVIFKVERTDEEAAINYTPNHD